VSARGWLEPLVAIAAAAALGAGFLLALGIDPRSAFAALAAGAVGDAHALETTLLRMSPLVLCGLAVAIAFRAGVWNIGAEGQLYAGALAAAAVGTALSSLLPSALLLAGALGGGVLAGGLLAGVAAALRVRRGVSEVLSTILLNFIAMLLVAWAVHGPLQEASGAYPQSEPLADAARLAVLPGSRRVHTGLLASLILPVALSVLLFRSAAGIRLRAVGLAPEVARYAGISPPREIARVLGLSGAIAGLAGAIEVCGVTGRLFENLSAGYGFTAIAVALLARLHPLAVLPAGAFFAALAAGSGAMQRQAGVPSVTVQVIEAFAILFSVSFALRRAQRDGEAAAG
jgi:simple sugar transport system permease protein